MIKETSDILLQSYKDFESDINALTYKIHYQILLNQYGKSIILLNAKTEFELEKEDVNITELRKDSLDDYIRIINNIIIKYDALINNSEPDQVSVNRMVHLFDSTIFSYKKYGDISSDY